MSHPTDYWTEPHGHVAAIRDAEGNVTTASYNALGQRTDSKDPDNQYPWYFSYDALGELLTQTDARGVVTTINGRDGVGRVTEQQQVPPSPAPPGLYFVTELDDWNYDPSHGIGELGSVQRRRGAGNAIPLATDTPVWQESYTYETRTARPSAITTTINEGATVTLGNSMTYDPSGRPDTHTYPSGLVVKNTYTAYGYLQSLTNNGTTTYWTATAQNEWDHVTGETFSGGITGTHLDYHSTGQAYQLSWSGSPLSDTFTYGYDTFSNLISQQRTGNAANKETYAYDPLQRLTAATRTSGGTVSYEYTKSGNLKYKTDFSINSGTGAPAYSYASANGTANGCGPHSPYSVALPGSLTATYTCDANGNVIGGDTLTAIFDADNHPSQITRTFLGSGPGDNLFCNGFDNGIDTCPNPASGGGALWAYDANGQRDYEYSPLDGTRYYGPGGYEQVGAKKIHELGPVIVTRTGGSDAITVVLRDRLGSTLDTIDGSLVTQRAFDAFGKARNGDLSDRPNGTLNLGDTIHGFTTHTHADDVALVHMGGRIFDPNLGRFLSVDPVLQFPWTSQGLNPYSYMRNSPLSGTDPTGYDEECEGFGKGDCNLTNVQSITVYQQKNGSYIAVAKDDQGNMVTADSITKFSSNGAVTTTGITQQFLQAVASRDSTAIVTAQQLGMGNTVFHGSDFMNHLAADIFGGFAKMSAEGTALALACGSSPMAAGACMAYGAGESAAHNPEGAAFIAAGMGGGATRTGAAASEETVASAQGMRGPTTVEETAASDADGLTSGYGVNDPPSRLAGPWTQRDLQRAAEGKGPLDLDPTTNAAGKEVPLELHHAGQMPGSAIHEAPPFHSKLPGLHPNQYNQGVTPAMRTQDAQLHWQLRGQEMGNPPPGGE